MFAKFYFLAGIAAPNPGIGDVGTHRGHGWQGEEY